MGIYGDAKLPGSKKSDVSDTPSDGEVLTYNQSKDQYDAQPPPGASGGEANTSSNVGTGAGLAKTKSGVDLPFKSIIAGTNLSAVENVNDVTLNVDAVKLDDHGTPDDNTDLDATTLVHGLMPKADKSKLDGIESAATADQSDSEIKTAYENNADTNAFTDSEKTKLAGVETSADVTDSANVNAAGATMNTDTDLSSNSYFLDQDNMSSNDATKVASQQSIKAYVDNEKRVLKVIRKTADESVTNSTTLQDDDHLTYASVANTLYYVECYLRWEAGSTEDIKFAITADGNAIGLWGWDNLDDENPLGSANGLFFGGAGAGNTKQVRLTAIVRTGATAPNIRPQWAQNTSGVTASKVLQESLMIIMEAKD